MRNIRRGRVLDYRPLTRGVLRFLHRFIALQVARNMRRPCRNPMPDSTTNPLDSLHSTIHEIDAGINNHQTTGPAQFQQTHQLAHLDNARVYPNAKHQIRNSDNPIRLKDCRLDQFNYCIPFTGMTLALEADSL